MSIPQLFKFSDFVQNISTAIQASASALTNFNSGSVLRAITEAVAAVGVFIESQVMYVLSLTRAATSSGADLDSWALDFGFYRLAATQATGLVTFSRFSTTLQAVVPIGAKVQTADGSQQFTITLDTTNSAYSASAGGYVVAVGVASVNVPVQAVNYGTGGNVIAAAISQIISPIPAIDTVTNGSAFSNALAAETDAAMRVRFISYINSLSEGTKIAIGAAIAGVQQGIQYTITENLTYGGAAAAAYFYVVVDDGTGAPSTPLLTSVNSAISAVRALGITWNVFSPSVTNVTAAMTITVASGYVKATYQPIVQAAIVAYINGLGLGNSLAYTRLAQVAYDCAPGVITDVTGLLLNGATSDIAATNQQTIKTVTGSVTIS